MFYKYDAAIALFSHAQAGKKGITLCVVLLNFILNQINVLRNNILAPLAKNILARREPQSTTYIALWPSFNSEVLCGLVFFVSYCSLFI